MKDFLTLHPLDNVAVALTDQGEIPAGHKKALRDIPKGQPVIKYGQPIGVASRDIRAGEWVHSHNLHTALSGEKDYVYAPAALHPAAAFSGTFQGYARADGRVGVRNEIWVLPLVGCVNQTARRIADRATAQGGAPVYPFPHPYGCSQLGEDHARTRDLLCALCRHPNAGGVLVLGLGCENNTMAGFREALGEVDERRVKFLVCQEAADEEAAALALIAQLQETLAGDVRTPQPLSKLVIGLKCGGSDGFSGITANPLLGALSDGVCAAGGTALLTEVPEMFGAEGFLMNRCRNEQVFEKAVRMINGFKEYFISHNEVVYDNPSPGNKQGGITTLEDKSCGCVQKGGSAPIMDVIDYGEPVTTKGLNMLYGPGNDLVSATALTAAGAHMVLFSTGRGTPFGAPAPTLKIATNSQLAARKKTWIDFNAGVVADGERTLDEAGADLYQLVLDVASGKQPCAEKKGFREISIFKDGVVL